MPLVSNNTRYPKVEQVLAVKLQLVVMKDLIGKNCNYNEN